MTTTNLDLLPGILCDRYQRGNRSLLDNLLKRGNVQPTVNQTQAVEEEEEEYDIPEELEDVIGQYITCYVKLYRTLHVTPGLHDGGSHIGLVHHVRCFD